MAFFEATPEIAKLDVIEGEPRSVCGTYELHTLTGKAGGPSYYCKAVQLYLYERAPGSWCVGRKSGGKSCKAYNSGEATEVGGWCVYKDKQWLSCPRVRLTFSASREAAAAADDDGEGDDEGAARAVAVACRYGNIAGGYLASGERRENGRAVYHNEEDGKDLWYGPEGSWILSDAAGLDEAGSYASYFGSAATDANRPEDADWSGAPVTVHPCEPPSAEEAAGANDDDVGDGGFHDADFAPGPGILDDPGRQVSWIRASRLKGDDEEVVLWDGVEPSDIMQGALGDCWLLCALSAVAEFPGFVEDCLFETKAVTPDGRYTMRLYDATVGDFVRVTVDDLIPCGAKKWWELPRPLYSQPHGNEMYILLLEKAFAKIAGSYGRLSGGYPVLAWLTLTGCEDLQMWHRAESGDAWAKSMISMPNVREDPHNYQALYTRPTPERLGDPDYFAYLLDCDARNGAGTGCDIPNFKGS